MTGETENSLQLKMQVLVTAFFAHAMLIVSMCPAVFSGSFLKLILTSVISLF